MVGSTLKGWAECRERILRVLTNLQCHVPSRRHSQQTRNCWKANPRGGGGEEVGGQPGEAGVFLEVTLLCLEPLSEQSRREILGAHATPNQGHVLAASSCSCPPPWAFLTLQSPSPSVGNKGSMVKGEEGPGGWGAGGLDVDLSRLISVGSFPLPCQVLFQESEVWGYSSVGKVLS